MQTTFLLVWLRIITHKMPALQAEIIPAAQHPNQQKKWF